MKKEQHVTPGEQQRKPGYILAVNVRTKLRAFIPELLFHRFAAQLLAIILLTAAGIATTWFGVATSGVSATGVTTTGVTTTWIAAARVVPAAFVAFVYCHGVSFLL